MHSNFVKRLLKAAWVLELVVAVLILAVTLLELFLLGEGTLSQVLGGSFSADAFFADAMTIVVGIEFVKMLMLHTPRAVTDVLLFAIARQLVVNHSSAVDTLLGVAAVALIFVIKKFLHTDGDDAPAYPFGRVLSAAEAARLPLLFCARVKDFPPLNRIRGESALTQWQRM